jgi:CheY-like chemotaxis protein
MVARTPRTNFFPASKLPATATPASLDWAAIVSPSNNTFHTYLKRYGKTRGMNATSERICSFIHMDDDADDLYLVRHAATRSGLPFKIEQFDSARRLLAFLAFPEAFAPVRKFSPPAFLLLDYQLQETTAPEVISQVRSLTQGMSLTIIIYSSSGDIGNTIRAYQAGANHFVTKSADLSRLRLILASLYCGMLTGNDFSLLAALPEYRMAQPRGNRHSRLYEERDYDSGRGWPNDMN